MEAEMGYMRLRGKLNEIFKVKWRIRWDI